jgi:hypothetical protein
MHDAKNNDFARDDLMENGRGYRTSDAIGRFS